ncbi:GIY-YIG nuclease family protein [Rhodococcus rhodochrous]|uniref:GIY-YIG nuclease family protein n=1 Tax=Rhodococcus rhodochrous TaxID=1829 RepID=UPI00178658D7|nr:GIY-YIG nuclease family protein [Rhodococcus rhodochrous]QOH59924.1 hypothetical protein C6Y44_27955 [Rhodococcus rhodochrous]
MPTFDGDTQFPTIRDPYVYDAIDLSLWQGEGTIVNPWNCPPAGIPVAYTLHVEGHPIYVGSTGDLHRRLNQHLKEGRVWTGWIALQALHRWDAYQQERALYEDYLRELGNPPMLNRVPPMVPAQSEKNMHVPYRLILNHPAYPQAEAETISEVAQ